MPFASFLWLHGIYVRSGGKTAESARARPLFVSQSGGGGYGPGLIFQPTPPDLLYALTVFGVAYRWDPATSSWIAITDGFA